MGEMIWRLCRAPVTGREEQTKADRFAFDATFFNKSPPTFDKQQQSEKSFQCFDRFAFLLFKFSTVLIPTLQRSHPSNCRSLLIRFGSNKAFIGNSSST